MQESHFTIQGCVLTFGFLMMHQLLEKLRKLLGMGLHSRTVRLSRDCAARPYDKSYHLYINLRETLARLLPNGSI